jgi:hypothetical protein
MKSDELDLWPRKRGIPAARSVLAAVLVAGLLTLPGELLAQGCAMCKTAVGGPEDPLARGLNVSILFLLSMPFVLAGSVGGWFFYMYRRTRRHVPVLRLVRAAKEGTS